MILTVQISNSPITNLHREVDARSFLVDDQEKKVELITICYSLKDGERILSNECRPFERKLTASNERLVNPENGIVVTSVQVEDGEVNQGTEEEPIMVMTYKTIYQQPDNVEVSNPVQQFDFFKAMLNSQVNIVQVIQGVILQEDAIYKTFDK